MKIIDRYRTKLMVKRDNIGNELYAICIGKTVIHNGIEGLEMTEDMNQVAIRFMAKIDDKIDELAIEYAKLTKKIGRIDRWFTGNVDSGLLKTHVNDDSRA